METVANGKDFRARAHGGNTPYALPGSGPIFTEANNMQIFPARWQPWMTRLTRSRPGVSEPPLRAELFSVEQLSLHAKAMAASHQVVTRQGGNCLLARLGQNEDILRAFNHASLAIAPGLSITPAAEWLLDNFYLIEEQIQLARRHLPRGYSRELPRLLNGPSAGLPRVYDIVLELITHVDAQIDAGPLIPFIAAYQTVVSLKLGELWAIPIMLRLGLIENLQRVTTRLVLAREDRDLAESYRLGVNAFVVKPVKYEEFAKAIGQVAHFWALLNESAPGTVPRNPVTGSASA